MPREEILKAIEQADDSLISDIIQAIIYRYSQMFPDWEVMFLSMHRSPEEREKDIEAIIEYLKRTKRGSLG